LMSHAEGLIQQRANRPNISRSATKSNQRRR
jgi:hypothetical protein